MLFALRAFVIAIIEPPGVWLLPPLAYGPTGPIP
jgi:hypothetical protein